MPTIRFEMHWYHSFSLGAIALYLEDAIARPFSYSINKKLPIQPIIAKIVTNNYSYKPMSDISICLPDDLLIYINQKAQNPNSLIESLLQQWRKQQENEALAAACQLIDELNLGWDEEWQTQAITDWEASG